MKGKTLIESKTFWFNILSVVLEIVVALQTVPAFSDKQSLLMVLGLIQTVGNVILRSITEKPITKIM